MGHVVPIWSCSGWGLPCRLCCQGRGVLLPHLFTLTPTGVVPHRGSTPQGRFIFCGAVLKEDQKSSSPGVTRHPFPWSPDFPLHKSSGRPAPLTTPPKHVFSPQSTNGQQMPNKMPNTAGAAGFEPAIPRPKPGALPLGHAPHLHHRPHRGNPSSLTPHLFLRKHVERV